jgi:hypothetical protein
VHCAPILPKPPGPFPKLPKKKTYKKKNSKKLKLTTQSHVSACGQLKALDPQSPTSGDQQSGPGRGQATKPQLLVTGSSATNGWQPTVGHRPRTGAQAFSLCNFFLIPTALLFLRMWSTLSHWFQHMPALPKVHLKTSNIHNF